MAQDSSAIRLVIADDQALVRGALAALLGLERDIEVVAEAGDGEAALVAVREQRADVALLDVQMPGLDGLATAERLRREAPQCRVLMVTTFGRPGYVRRALQAGAAGFVVKDTPARQLADAVRKVHAGLRVIDPSLAAESLVTGESPLTAREVEVLRVSAGGGTVADIAREVFLSEGTVRNHLSAAMAKTGGRTRGDAARIAAENGWLL